MKRYQQLRRCTRYRISCDDISSNVITFSSWLSADENRNEKMKRRRAEESADGLALMTTSVTSSQSADGLGPAVARYQQTQATAHPVVSYFVPAVAIHPVASFVHLVAKLKYQTQSIQSTKISAEDEFRRCDKPAAKQLTIYEELSKLESTAELNSNGENDKKPAKEKDASTIPCRYFTRHISNGMKLCPTGRNLNGGLYISRAPLKKVDEWTSVRDVGATTAQLQKYIDYTVHQQRENEKKDETIDRH
ncbi:hypothetical protein F511_16005 [Dorcoceras hygrometricum]|uniref:Uncharacterized protein n=1 Tax=Dorcoceras hygrometricum TaxID=472368 RepID=A0A2Z7AE40_9LAMI|nr:hypothetical protein F511_16005 [Dorcoceras hygrometricum]